MQRRANVKYVKVNINEVAAKSEMQSDFPSSSGCEDTHITDANRGKSKMCQRLLLGFLKSRFSVRLKYLRKSILFSLNL